MMKARTLIRRFAPYFAKYKGILVFDLFCAALTTLCELVLPLIVRNITDQAINAPASLTAGFILRLGALYLLLRLVDSAASYFMTNQGHVMGTRIETDMRRDLFSHMQKLGFSYYSHTKVGQLMARMTSDLFDVTEFAHHCPEEFFIAGIKIVFAFAILSSMNLWLTLLIFLMLPLMFICVRRYNHRMHLTAKENRHQIGEINAQVEDSLLGIRVAKSFANEPLEEEKFAKGNQRFLTTKRNYYRTMAGFHTTTRTFDGLMYILVVIAGALFIMGGDNAPGGGITPADYMAYLLYVSTLLTSVRRIVEFAEQFHRGMTGVERFFEIMDEPIEIQDEPGATELTDVKGDVTFENVSFHYSDDDHQVLGHLNLAVRAGSSIALVGPSGGGKTTLCNLIPRFYDVTGGRILLDGRDIKTLTLKSLRDNIGMVQQEVYLFSGTVYENIVYGKPGATRQQVEEAAKQAGAHEFITQLPQGYDTYVGERGVRLSGGQKQRLSIARVFLKNPPILILDEATSALDNESERLVQKSLEELQKGRTTFTIAHRLTTIRNADTIWVLTDKGVEEQGSHQELMAKKGLYHQLYDMYTTD